MATGAHFFSGDVKWPAHPKISSKTSFLSHNFCQARSKGPKATSNLKVQGAKILQILIFLHICYWVSEIVCQVSKIVCRAPISICRASKIGWQVSKIVRWQHKIMGFYRQVSKIVHWVSKIVCQVSKIVFWVSEKFFLTPLEFSLGGANFFSLIYQGNFRWGG